MTTTIAAPTKELGQLKSDLAAAETTYSEALDRLQAKVSHRQLILATGTDKEIDAVDKELKAAEREVERTRAIVSLTKDQIRDAESAEQMAKVQEAESLVRKIHDFQVKLIHLEYAATAKRLAEIAAMYAAARRFREEVRVEGLIDANRTRMTPTSVYAPFDLTKELRLPRVMDGEPTLWNGEDSERAARANYVELLGRAGFDIKKFAGPSGSPAAGKAKPARVAPTVPGAPYEGGYYVDDVGPFSDGQMFALVIAPKACGQMPTAQHWCNSEVMKTSIGALDLRDGRANTQLMAQAGSEMAEWALKLEIDGKKGWHIPSLIEGDRINANLRSRSAAGRADPDLFGVGGQEEIGSVALWTSTEDKDDPTRAFVIHNRGRCDSLGKRNMGYSVRAVRLVPL
jgi:hypothetical protein